MAEPLKTFFSSALVRRLAREVARVHPGFPVRAFTNDACRGLDALELLDRGRHIADALGAHLPASYPDAIGILLRSLGPEHTTDELIGVGMAPFFYKIGRVALAPGERVELKTRFSLAVHTTRVPRPGRHAVDVIVNGRAIRVGSFDVCRA